MSIPEQIARQLNLLAQDAASLIKVLLLSKKGVKQRPVDPERELFILGNGPSLRQAIDSYGDRLSGRELMAVNFFANTPDFDTLRPGQYILADGHFFDGISTDPNVARLWQRLRQTEWPMTLHVPASRLDRANDLFPGKVLPFNLTPVEGHTLLTHHLTAAGLGMPRPRNVLIPAIMVSVLAGYGKIYLLGADHSWSRTLSVDNKNRVLSRQPHFYADNESELDRVAEEYKGYHLHDILHSLTVAFRSYHEIKRYTRDTGTDIINLTPDSMIDAFARADLGNILHN